MNNLSVVIISVSSGVMFGLWQDSVMAACWVAFITALWVDSGRRL